MAGISAAAAGKTPRAGNAGLAAGRRGCPACEPVTSRKLKSCDGPLAKASCVVMQADARAGLARRLAATVYESLILAALALVLGSVLLPVMGLTATPAAGARLALMSPAARAMSFAALFALYAGYCKPGDWHCAPPAARRVQPGLWSAISPGGLGRRARLAPILFCGLSVTVGGRWRPSRSTTPGPLSIRTASFSTTASPARGWCGCSR
jgi:hypothetical protein